MAKAKIKEDLQCLKEEVAEHKPKSGKKKIVVPKC